MTAREKLLREIQHSSEPLVKEVLDFLLFARSKNYSFVESEVIDPQTPTTNLGICSRINARCPTRGTCQTPSR